MRAERNTEAARSIDTADPIEAMNAIRMTVMLPLILCIHAILLTIVTGVLVLLVIAARLLATLAADCYVVLRRVRV